MCDQNGSGRRGSRGEKGQEVDQEVPTTVDGQMEDDPDSQVEQPPQERSSPGERV